MAKSRCLPMMACEVMEPDPNSEARYLEGMPHGGYDWRGSSDETRDGLGGRDDVGGPYTHHHNPDQQHARTVASDPSGRATGASCINDGLECREPLRADLDDSMK